MRIVEVHAIIPFLLKHRLHLLRSVDAVIENQGFRPFGLFLVRIKQFLLHQIISVEPLRTAHGIVAVDANLQGSQIHVVTIGGSLGKELLVDEG